MDHRIELGGAGEFGPELVLPNFNVGESGGGSELTPEEMEARAELLVSLEGVMKELLGVLPEDFSEESRFDEDLGTDSLGLVEVVMAIEDALDIKIPENSLEGVTTIGQAISLARTIQKENAVKSDKPDDKEG